MLDAMNADFLLSTDVDPDLEDFYYLNKRSRIGLVSVLMCAVAQSIMQVWEQDNFNAFETYLRANLRNFSTKYARLCKGYQIKRRMTGKMRFMDNLPITLVTCIPIAVSNFKLEDKQNLALVVMHVLQSGEENQLAAECFNRIMAYALTAHEKKDFISYVDKHILKFKTLDITKGNAVLENNGLSYLACALKLAIVGGGGQGAVKYILKYFGRNRVLAALTTTLACCLKNRRIVTKTECCSFQGYWHGRIPKELTDIDVKFRHLLWVQDTSENDARPMEKYPDVFLEAKDNGFKNYTGPMIHHNHFCGSCSFDLRVLHNLDDEKKFYVEKEYISIHEDNFVLIQRFIQEDITDWDIYEDFNPLRISDLRKKWKIAEQVMADLESGRKSELLKQYYTDISLYCFDGAAFDESFMLSMDETMSIEVKKAKHEKIYWKALFNHKDEIAEFVRAFFWFFLEHLKLKDDDNAVINISGY